MNEWHADIMTDSSRGHQLHVELLQDDKLWARLYEDERGQLQLAFYDDFSGEIPVEWLIGIIDRFKDDLRCWHKHAQL